MHVTAGVAFGMPNITRMIVVNSAQLQQEIDWKLAYFEVVAITNEVKAALPAPEQQTPRGEHVVRVDTATCW